MGWLCVVVLLFFCCGECLCVALKDILFVCKHCHVVALLGPLLCSCCCCCCGVPVVVVVVVVVCIGVLCCSVVVVALLLL